MSKFLYVVDESGNLGGGAGQSDGFVFGGYIIHERDVTKGIREWKQLKLELCGSSTVELKWNHFFKPAADNPLLVQDENSRRLNGIRVAKRIFTDIPLIPLIGLVQKSRVTSPDMFRVSKKGNPTINLEQIWYAPLGAFAGFLDRKQAIGEIHRDSLSGISEENKWNVAWSNLLTTIHNSPHDKGLSQMIARISSPILFFDSANNDLIQLADCICGIVFSASIRNESYLKPVIKYFDDATKKHGLGIYKLI